MKMQNANATANEAAVDLISLVAIDKVRRMTLIFAQQNEYLQNNRN